MTSDMDDSKTANASVTHPTLSDNLADKTWQLDALTEALGDLTLPITDSLSVGRGSDNDLVLGSKEVSRNHALLSVANDQLYIKDLDSSNGTFINDERIAGNQSRALKSADIVGFASFSFQVLAVADKAKEMPVTGTDGINTADISSINNDTLDNPTTTNITNDNTTAVDTHHDNAVSPDTSPDASTTAEAISLATGAAATKSTISTGYKSKAPDGTININDVVDGNTATDVIDNDSTDISNTATHTDTKLPSTKLPSSNEPVVKKTMVTEVLAASDSARPVTPITNQNNTDEPIVKETIITEVLTAADSTDLSSTDAPISHDSSVLDETSTPTPTANAPTYEETVMSTEPSKDTAHSTTTDNTTTDEHSTKRAPYHDDTVASEHDKTTTTELQEEADPDVLRAKQAATAQFSGTANLGGSRDLGTTGNNAMDQAIDNPANAANTDKKPSGGWFIWVFIIILIIGIALWLFNMGGA